MHRWLATDTHHGGLKRSPEWQETAKKACSCPLIYYILNKKYSNNQAEAKGYPPNPQGG
jgi:hypothetical protein